ncbi:hypothetical protein ARMGADRAFT_229614 [Armillaria gallica]|uniref:Uncharacterized protein n=1 Tax=Armillaria gallica TaxID=47427 RepID=A0A2H3EE07_ARMGA|nr:hypothetical protein ARMGADRAFT_229614 [Armillaria gallica]
MACAKQRKTRTNPARVVPYLAIPSLSSVNACHLVALATASSRHHTRRMQQHTDHRDHHPSPPSQGIKGAHIHDTTANPSFFPPPTISAFSSLDARRLPTLISTGPLVAHNWPAIPGSHRRQHHHFQGPASHKGSRRRPTQRKQEPTFRPAINASRADPVLASALKNTFTEALSNAESNASYKTVLHRRRKLTLWAIIIDNVADGHVKREDVWNVKDV